MNILKQYLRHFIKSALVLKARGSVSVLNRSKDAWERMIGEVLGEALDYNVTNDEKLWIDKIQSLRKELESSTEKIELIDFGAIKPDLNLSDEQLKIGRTIPTTIGAKCKSGSELFFWVFILFKLIRKYKPSSCLELGACMGMSASFQAAALTLNGKGRIVTVEGDPTLASIAKRNFNKLSLNNASVETGRFQDILPGVLPQYGPFDFVFIDGHLDGKASIDNLNLILPHFADKAIFVLDNVSWSKSMRNGWKFIEGRDEIKNTFHLRQMGICIIDKTRKKTKNHKIPLL
jgi:predicted O-methyltransferase YrrM